MSAFDAVRLARAIERFEAEAGRDGARRLAILHRGDLVHAGPEADRAQGVWSITKTILSTTLGLLVDDGRVALDQPVTRVLPELAAAFSDATFRHFAGMTSGYRAIGDEAPIKGYAHGPSRSFMQPAPTPQSAPGTTFSYWDSAPNMLALALTRVAGEPLAHLLRRRILEPLGIDLEWGAFLVDGQRVHGGAGNHFGTVQISCLDLCRLGELYRCQGLWHGHRLLSADWCAAATSVQVPAGLALHETPFDGRGCYGFFWWVNGVTASGARKWPGVEAGAYSASGYNNNDLFVLPEEELVVCRLGHDQDFDGAIGDDTYAALLNGIVAARS
jgi:CubicO group peptidase (beta-lactamase class C family)